MEKQMDPSDAMDFAIYIGEKNCSLGIVQCQKGCTYSDIHCEIVDYEIIEYPLDFIGPIGIPLNKKQEKKGNLQQQMQALRGNQACWLLKHCNHM